MSLKRFALLAALSLNQQQQFYNNNNISKNNSSTTTALPTTSATISSDSLTKIIDNKKSALLELQQQKQHQIVASTSSSNFISKTTTIPSKSVSAKSSALIPQQAHAFYSDDNLTHDHINSMGITSDSSISSSSYFDDDAGSNILSGEVLDPIDSDQEVPFTPPHQHQTNTYTSTTYYGSGFGVFHQQNIRSNGGGIALITGNSGNNGLGSSSYSNGINNNVNLLLGGAMLTLITTILCVVCYCCHRNIKKRTEAAYRQQRQWLENDPNMEIYSVEQCYETSGLFVGDSMDGLATIPALHHEPPPSYDAVVAMQEQQQLLMQQQQILMQQQLLQQQQLSTNNSPPPGYRSSLDVSTILPSQRSATGVGNVMMMGSSIISGMDVNSLASSAANIATASTLSPIDPLMNYNDVNGNMANTGTTLSVAATLANNDTAQSFLRNKQQQQQQRNMPGSQLSQLNIKKVLQAQSCCSLQRAEVENMWNAAAAALAARSSHIQNDMRSTAASTVASTSSPTLAVNARKLSSTPETFGSRYLKQNYYRRGCPLCGKFRYDNDSQLSTSVESNLDTLQGARIAENQSSANAPNSNRESLNNDLNGNDNNSKRSNSINDINENNQNKEEDTVDTESGTDDNEMEDEVDEDECETVEQQCSCLYSRRMSNKMKFEKQNRYQKLNLQQESNDSYHETNPDNQNQEENQTKSKASDANANSSINTEGQSTNQASNNNNNFNEDNMELPSTSSAAIATNAPSHSAIIEALQRSSSSVNINLDRINENGIISLDMSKIIDKTGLPTYDAALKLESSGYV